MSLQVDIQCAGQGGFELSLRSEIPASGVTAIYGPSGSGKSTLLDCIAGLRQPTAGEICFGSERWFGAGHHTPAWQRRIAYVFQDARLFPHLSVAANLDYASRRARAAPAMAPAQLHQTLGLTGLLSHAPATLSAGQKQRVAIGRALLSAPRLLLLDEPLANLDQQASAECLGLLQQIASELELPMLYVSHDIEEVSQLADHLLLLDDGRLVDEGSLLSLSSRLDSRLAHEEQAAALLQGTIAAQDERFSLTEINVEGETLYVNHLPQPVGATRRLRIPARDVSVCRSRPEDSSILNILPVTVSDIEDCRGARLLLRLQLGQQYLLARITRKSAQRLALASGDRLFAQIKSAALLSEAGDWP
ncbi:molybdenum ABC transporter ATP-binding protein [Seongchinamella sediminis]|uniref:Molybdenum ABC transporter ATP-binding protein n=1 Tax=Seongchinamella sediminis TaxID=2283635 RepID=A0A3L7DX82_9GAMM|nr:molybdenum ABC transporter ATP-binding protein [Seongchinamella sediminis]RLQ22168.1 molybdenum ABC transporter ATP-binding protein [Seongchinamella sediminis]